MKRILLSLSLTIISLLGITPVVYAAKPVAMSAANKTALGIDVSWPQCGKILPADQAFGIVGVNGGLATTTNPCLNTQLVWAGKSKGGTSQDKVQLYVNTANPGGLNTPSWPVTGSPENPFGACDGSDSLACAWQYGWNRAREDVTDRFRPAADQAGADMSASSYVWWLDVETENTWKTGGKPFDYQSNVAVLEGMAAHFKTVNARVGLYSTGAQWSQITGNAVSPASNLNGLDNWRPGGASLNTAKQACAAAPLTPNGKVVLTQFVSKGLDYDFSCV
jgi:hypothetical protein